MSRRRCLVLTLALGGCLSVDPQPSLRGQRDAFVPGDPTDAAPTDAAPTDAAPDRGAADPARGACEAALADGWSHEPVVTGLGAPGARASYARVIGKLMTDFGVPGGAVAVSRDGKLVLALGLGLADVDQPAHPDQLFRIASLSKQITAAAVTLLVERGQLGLDEKVFAILADYQPLPGRTMNPQLADLTVRQLLQHSGGWNRGAEAVGDPMGDSQRIAAAFGQPGPADQNLIIRYMLDKPLTYVPGSTTCYSNFGYTLLGRIIERKSRSTYANFVAEKLLAPAEVRMLQGSTRAELRADDEVHYFDPGTSRSVFPDVKALVPRPYGNFYLEAMDAHGAWVASPIEMVRFQLTIDGRPTHPDVISADSRAAMVANPMVPGCTSAGGTTPADPGYWYGFGLQVNKFANTWHSGALAGTATEAVTASNGFAWAAFFNGGQNGDFYNRLDADLWKALEGAGTWTDHDLFDQYTGPGAWLPAAAHLAEVERRRLAGDYPVRTEGQSSASGTAEYRARFAPRPAKVRAASVIDVDCLAYREASEQQAAAGFSLTSLQSFVAQAGQRRYQATWTTGF